MEIERNKNLIYCDPNAYIQNIKKPDKDKPKKIVFQEPYECLPNFYINNGFKKCDCNYGCNNTHKPCNESKKHCEENNKPCNNEKKSSQNFLGIDLKNLMPMLGGLLGANSNGGIGNILSALNTNQNKSSGFDLSKILSTLFSNGNGFNLLNLFNKKQQKKDVKLKSTDFQINEYTRVE